MVVIAAVVGTVLVLGVAAAVVIGRGSAGSTAVGTGDVVGDGPAAGSCAVPAALVASVPGMTGAVAGPSSAGGPSLPGIVRCSYFAPGSSLLVERWPPEPQPETDLQRRSYAALADRFAETERKYVSTETLPRSGAKEVFDDSASSGAKIGLACRVADGFVTVDYAAGDGRVSPYALRDPLDAVAVAAGCRAD